MFKKFDSKSIGGQTQLKSSAQRNVRQKIAEQMPLIEPHLDDLLPKKSPMFQAKVDRITLYSMNGKVLFFTYFDGPFMPTLLVLHKYPDILPKVQVDRGAIKFVLKGADVMCPGMTSPGGDLPVDLPVDAVCQIVAEGKEHALAIGVTKMSTADIKSINKGIGIEAIHYLNDGLYQTLVE